MKAECQGQGSAFSAAGDVASATECTGLMPALPEDEAQDEAEAALYAIHSAKKNKAER